MRDAKAVEYQLRNKWPADDTVGIVTVKGRTFHADERCPGYQQGLREAARKGREMQPVEKVTAAAARAREKAPCSRCWRDGKVVAGRP